MLPFQTMKKYGETFRQFRESRNYSLTDIAQPGLSVSQLSRFERGETNLTISKLVMALNEINLTMEEFMYATNEFKLDELDEILEKIKACVLNKDSAALKKLLILHSESSKQRKKFHQLNTILIKIRLQDLSGETYYSEKDVQILIDYLVSVENWGNYELLLFGNTLDHFNHDTFIILAREMIRRSDYYRELPSNRRLISHMTLNTYITCIERNKLIDALYFEKQLEACYFDESEIYEHIVFNYAKNYFDYKKRKNPNSITEMRKCIGILKLVDSNHIAQTSQVQTPV